MPYVNPPLHAHDVALIDLYTDIISHIFDKVEKPIYVEHGPDEAGFRFQTGTPLIYCMLKLARTASALNAMKMLYEGGFTQEIAVLVRTVIDHTSHAEYVAHGYNDPVDQDKVLDHVDRFFADSRRNRNLDFARTLSRQEEIHKTVGRYTDAAKAELNWRDSLPEEFSERPDLLDRSAASLMSEVYLRFSTYVHARYPEVMDMFGGQSVIAHLDGMRGTPKDYENREMISEFLVTACNALKFVIYKFHLEEMFADQLQFRIWLKSKS